MEDELIHELAAGYALDALGAEEEQAFEAHLARCPRCQEDVAAFAEIAAELAFAAPDSPLPDGLRERILDAARRERGQVVPLRPRWAYQALAAAAAATCVAIGLGVWAANMHSQLGSDEALHGLPLTGASGSVVRTRSGQAELVVSGLATPPSGKTYEIWVLRGSSAQAAGLFSPTGKTTVVRLKERVPSGGRVGITVEPAGGSPRPTAAPVVLSATA